MIIEKNGNIYNITEYNTKWVVKSKSGKLSVSYDVTKDICATADELRDYIVSNDMF